MLWILGYPDQALQKSSEALSLAQELAHPFSLALALTFVAVLHEWRREMRAAQEQAGTLIMLASEQGFPFWLAAGMGIEGWAMAAQGRGVEGIPRVITREHPVCPKSIHMILVHCGCRRPKLGRHFSEPHCANLVWTDLAPAA